MAGLVADYGSSSDEDQEKLTESLLPQSNNRKAVDYFSIKEIEVKSSKRVSSVKPKKKPKKVKLDNPLRIKTSLKKTSGSNKILPNPFDVDSTVSVFYNPFQKEREAKKMVLEKHVKMTDNPKDVLEINGKKICWNYRKGKCKFGHRCKYAHDSDLIENLETQSEAKDSNEVVSKHYHSLNPSDWSIEEAAQEGCQISEI